MKSYGYYIQEPNVFDHIKAFCSPRKRYRKDEEEGLLMEDKDASMTDIFKGRHTGMDIHFENVCLKKGNKEILSNVSGCFKAGRLTAIMGASGIFYI